MKEKVKNILIVTSEFPPQPGGIGNHAYYLGLSLSKKGYLVRVIADQRDKSNMEEMVFDESLPFDVVRIKLRKFRLFMYVERIVETISAMKHTDFIIATGKFSLWNVALCSNFIKRPKMAVIHGSEVNLKHLILRKAVNQSLKSFETIVAVSNFTKKLISYLKLNVHVIPNGVDLSRWKVITTNENTLKGSPKLVTVGRVSNRKGQLQVIKHIPELVKLYPNIHYHCVGILTEAKDFKKAAKSLGVASHITFHGALKQRHLVDILCQSDIFIMLSTHGHDGDVEGFGIAILEANSLGVPAIGSLGCGIEDAINQEVSGLLVNHEKTRELVSGIGLILNNYNQYQKGALSWANKHDWNQIVEKYIKLIE